MNGKSRLSSRPVETPKHDLSGVARTLGGTAMNAEVATPSAEPVVSPDPPHQALIEQFERFRNSGLFVAAFCPSEQLQEGLVDRLQDSRSCDRPSP
jgi:hypothetical protein